MKKNSVKYKALLAFWKMRLKMRAEGDKMYAEGRKMYAEGYKMYAEGDKMWAEGVIEILGNVEIVWTNECCIVDGMVFKNKQDEGK